MGKERIGHAASCKYIGLIVDEDEFNIRFSNENFSQVLVIPAEDIHIYEKAP